MALPLGTNMFVNLRYVSGIFLKVGDWRFEGVTQCRGWATQTCKWHNLPIQNEVIIYFEMCSRNIVIFIL